jgi:hypothetical protein
MMPLDNMSFGTLRLTTLGNRVLIDGPRHHLSALKKHLELCDLRPAVRREPEHVSLSLEIRPVENAERVRAILEEWTD